MNFMLTIILLTITGTFLFYERVAQFFVMDKRPAMLISCIVFAFISFIVTSYVMEVSKLGTKQMMVNFIYVIKHLLVAIGIGSLLAVIIAIGLDYEIRNSIMKGGTVTAIFYLCLVTHFNTDNKVGGDESGEEIEKKVLVLKNSDKAIIKEKINK